MSVEKMTMMNVIGDIDSVDEVLRDILLAGNVDLVSAMSQSEDSSFMFKVGDDTLEKTLYLNYITSFEKDESCEKSLKMARELADSLEIEGIGSKPNFEEYLKEEDISSELDNIYKEIIVPIDKIKQAYKELEKVADLYKSCSHIRDIDIPVKDLGELEYFNYKFGILSKEDKLKLNKNYENILAVILDAGSIEEGDVYFVLYPKSLHEIGRAHV